MPIHRHLKNVVKNYTEAERKVREATSNDPWGPSSTIMSEIADMTYNVMCFVDIMQMLWKRLNDKNKNWRHVYKALILMDYIIKTGSEKVAARCRENIHTIETLKDFQYVEEGKDLGINVRLRAEFLCVLLREPDRLIEERERALKAKTSSNITSGSFKSKRRHSGGNTLGSSEMNDEDAETKEKIELELALAISRKQHELEMQQRLEQDERDKLKLEMAIEQSRLDEEKRKKLQKSHTIHTSTASSRSTNYHSLFHQLIDTSLSAAPANLPDPWASNTSNSKTTQSSPNRDITTKDPWVAPSNIPSSSTSLPITNDLLERPQLLTSSSNTSSNTTVSTNERQFSNANNFVSPFKSSSKKPEDFLGEHRNLVDLNRLVDIYPTSTNPFAVGKKSSLYGNPFVTSNSNGKSSIHQTGSFDFPGNSSTSTNVVEPRMATASAVVASPSNPWPSAQALNPFL